MVLPKEKLWNPRGSTRIIIPLDVATTRQALKLVRGLKSHVGGFKIGLELYTSLGPRIIQAVRDELGDEGFIFYDGKFLDIPNTVAGAARAAVRMGVDMFNLHTTGGSAMMNAAVDAAKDEAAKLGIPRPIILGVTMLTSIDKPMMNDELGIVGEVDVQVVRLAILAEKSGLDGVISSAKETRAILDVCGNKFFQVTPGIRLLEDSPDDQKRVVTAEVAVDNGSDYIVVGRAITGKDNPAAVADMIGERIS